MAARCDPCAAAASHWPLLPADSEYARQRTAAHRPGGGFMLSVGWIAAVLLPCRGHRTAALWGGVRVRLFLELGYLPHFEDDLAVPVMCLQAAVGVRCSFERQHLGNDRAQCSLCDERGEKL